MPSTSANTAAGAIRFLPPSVSVSFCKAANDPEQAASAPGPQNIETSNSKAHHGSAKHEVRLRPLWRFRPRSGFAPTDETLRRKRATTRDALDGEADIWCATRLEGGVYEKLLEYAAALALAVEIGRPRASKCCMTLLLSGMIAVQMPRSLRLKRLALEMSYAN